MNAIQGVAGFSGDAVVAAADGITRKRVVIVGGGFAGLAAAKALRHADCDVLLVDRRNHHIFQPLLYQVAMAVLSPAEIAAPLRQLEATQRNLTVLLAEVTAIDREGRTLDALLPCGGTRRIGFDYLVVAVGAQPSYFGHDEFAGHAPPLKTIGDAETMRAKILSAFEAAEETANPDEQARLLTFVLVGAGPTGVELAASLAQMVRGTLRGNFRRIDPASARIVLIDGAKRILPGFSETVSNDVAARLARLGVEVRTGLTVQSVDDQGVTAGDDRIPSAAVMWTAGVAVSPLVKQSGAPTDHAGRAVVDPFLRATDAHGIFVVGDAASAKFGGRPVPGVAQAAIQQGHYVGRLIARDLNGQPARAPFRYFDKGNMAIVGKNFAVLERGSFHSKGFLTWLIWVFIHILSLPRMQNRLRVQRQWLWSYFTGQRSSRIIPEKPRR